MPKRSKLETRKSSRSPENIQVPPIPKQTAGSLPGSRPHRALISHLRDVRELVRSKRPIGTFPTWFPALAVDHIFVNGALQPLSLTVHRSSVARIASDHFPLIAELVLSS
jgi:endonuclease/exonuclease/phosphatase family metal-dependent hydrolase